MIAIDQDKKGRQGVQVAPAAVASTPASAKRRSLDQAARAR